MGADSQSFKISILDNRTILAVQEEFSKHYPYLKLEFFTRSHKIGTGSPKKQMRSVEHTLGECRTQRSTGQISIKPSMTVAELEQVFKESFGLNVQLFRKSGKVWLETTVTDSWTLLQQNDQGETLSNLIQQKPLNPLTQQQP